MIPNKNIRPLHPLTKDERELNKDNAWYASIKGESDLGVPAIRRPRLPGRIVSRSQRTAIINERDGESGNVLNAKQRKATHGY